jgi:hypothetical protein
MGFACLNEGEMEKSVDLLKKSAKLYQRVKRTTGLANYNIACCYALQNKVEKAQNALVRANGRCGCPPKNAALSDPQLIAVREFIQQMEWLPCDEEEDTSGASYSVEIHDDAFFQNLAQIFPIRCGV